MKFETLFLLHFKNNSLLIIYFKTYNDEHIDSFGNFNINFPNQNSVENYEFTYKVLFFPVSLLLISLLIV